jgi:putative pyruvate formate lyase activating enzyme
MYRQKGATLVVDNQGYAMNGIIIRHLVLPGHAENSIKVMETIAGEVSNKLHISLMSQYHPNHHVYYHPELGKTLKAKDYYKVVDAMEKLGFSKGWVQEMSSAANYLPDFRKKHPFERM